MIKVLIITLLTKLYLVICFDKITNIFSIVDEFRKDSEKITPTFLQGKYY